MKNPNWSVKTQGWGFTSWLGATYHHHEAEIKQTAPGLLISELQRCWEGHFVTFGQSLARCPPPPPPTLLMLRWANGLQAILQHSTFRCERGIYLSIKKKTLIYLLDCPTFGDTFDASQLSRNFKLYTGRFHSRYFWCTFIVTEQKA